MRNVLSRFATSLAALISDSTTVIDADNRVEAIRESMIAAVRGLGMTQNERAARVFFDISRANDVQVLWYLRSDLLRLLSEERDERTAREQLVGITELFRGLVADNQMPATRNMGKK